MPPLDSIFLVAATSAARTAQVTLAVYEIHAACAFRSAAHSVTTPSWTAMAWAIAGAFVAAHAPIAGPVA